MEKDIEAKGESPTLRPDMTEGNVELPRAPTAIGRFVDSFKRNPNARVTPEVVDADGKPLPDQPPAEPALAMKLKPRHLQMIAIGGSIGTISPFRVLNFAYNTTGTGLFVGSGSALANGGPGSLIIAYGLIGVMLFCTVHALGELAVAFPVAGSFSAYSSRFLDPAWGFAMGWK
jgi:amino acid transporter